jgi:hypothetical protein
MEQQPLEANDGGLIVTNAEICASLGKQATARRKPAKIFGLIEGWACPLEEKKPQCLFIS